MKAILAELKEACISRPSPADGESISRGLSTWFTGRPAQASKGTVALTVSDDARIIISEDDILAVERDGDSFRVEVSADANVLLRIDKILKATVHSGCTCGTGASVVKHNTGGEEGQIIDIGDIELCDLVCFKIWGIRFCIPVNCRKIYP